MPALTVGSPAPDFTLPTGDGGTVSLSDFRGKTVVLYFYPRDNTPGCTREACGFQAEQAAIVRKGAVVLGVSADTPDAHRRFAEKYRLTFPLLSDGKKEVITAYGVWKRKSLYGRTFLGIERTTFIIDRRGIISRIFRKVKVNGHTEDVLNNL